MSEDQTTPTPTPKPLPPVGEWLCRNSWAHAIKAFNQASAEPMFYRDYDKLDENTKQVIWLYAQTVVATMIGKETAEMVFAGKAEILATAKAHKDRDQREGGEE